MTSHSGQQGAATPMGAVREMSGQLDALTGLPDRQSFYRFVADERRSSIVAGVLLAEIAGFTRINDTWGDARGDRCLVELAGWLREVAAAEDIVARVSANRFAIAYGPDSAIVDEVRESGERVLQIGAQQIGVSVRSGWSGRGSHQPLHQVLRQAEQALAVAKGWSWRSVVQWSAPISLAAAADLTDEETVRRAISGRQLVVALQPVVDVQARSVVSVEALARLGSTTDSMPAERLVEISRRLGLGAAFAGLIFEQAFRDGASLAGVLPGAKIAVNVSRDLLGAGHAVDAVAQAAIAAGVALADVIVEVTEHAADGVSTATLVTAAEQIRALGMRVVIDDFGKGETSLSLLRSLPLSGVKIDRSLLPADSDDEGWRFLDGVVAMLRAMPPQLVAEGVETTTQSRRLADLGIVVQQGYLYGRPHEANHWLANQVWLPER